MSEGPLSPTRLRVLVVGFLILSLLLTARLGYWQVVRRDELVAQALQQVRLYQELPAQRGVILDRNGELLATTVALNSVYAIPAQMADRPAVAAALAPLLGEDPATLLARLEGGAEWLFLRRRVPEEVSAAVRALELPGVGLQPEPKRMYPNDSIGAGLLGFVNDDGAGQYGIEGFYEAVLRGMPGRLVVERDQVDRVLAVGLRQVEPAVDGSDLVLTIDLVLQSAAERELLRAVTAERAAGGTLVILDPATGAILALASVPGYDPNTVARADPEAFRDRAIAWTFEPGSTMKSITIAAALDEGAVTPDLTYVDHGSIEIGGRVLRNALGRVHGALDLSAILEKSVNTGAVFVAQQLGAERLHDALGAFGFGTLTGVDLAGEASGTLRPLAHWYPVDLGTAAFGQGLSVTPLQLAAAYAAIANGGMLYRPYVVAEVRGPDGVRRTEPTAVREVITPETAAILREMLTRTVDRGLGHGAALPGYSVAGKTGTAQIASPDGRYLDDEYIASFAGMAPASAPEFVVVVVIERPQSALLGTLSAMAAFRGLGLDLMRHARIEPDRVR